VVGFFELDVVIAGMAVDDGEFEGIIGTFGHNAFEEIVDIAFFYFWVVERNSGMSLIRFLGLINISLY
jgi:hypothetical protein